MDDVDALAHRLALAMEERGPPKWTPRYLAQDADGTWELYADCPTLCVEDQLWNNLSTTGGLIDHRPLFQEVGPVPWENTLIKLD